MRTFFSRLFERIRAGLILIFLLCMPVLLASLFLQTTTNQVYKTWAIPVACIISVVCCAVFILARRRDLRLKAEWEEQSRQLQAQRLPIIQAFEAMVKESSDGQLKARWGMWKSNVMILSGYPDTDEIWRTMMAVNQMSKGAAQIMAANEVINLVAGEKPI